MMAVLGVAGCALAFDRAVLGTGAGGPSEAAAQVTPGTADSTTTPSAPLAASPDRGAGSSALANDAAPRPSLRESVASQLQGLQLPESSSAQGKAGLDDAFWDASRPLEVIEVAHEPEQPLPPAAPAPLQAASRHALTAILTTPAGPIAVVDGRALRVGRPSGGLTLKGVDGRSTAIVEIDGREVRLELRRETQMLKGAQDARDTRDTRDTRDGSTRDVR